MNGIPPRLRVEDLWKSFGSVPVLAGISLDLRAGETHALLGENGSGKSTLVKVVAGYHAAERGRLLFDGVETSAEQMRDRVTVIHQDLGLVGELSVFDNIAVGIGFGTRAVLPIGRRSMRTRIRTAVELIGGDLDLDARVGTLTAPERTMVGIARAVTRLEPDRAAESLFILDEPTAVATAEQAASIMRLIRDMADTGAAVMYITHRVAEALTADTVTVLRDGRVALSAAGAGLVHQDVISAMLGRRLDAYYPDKLPAPDGTPSVLRAKALGGEIVRDFDLDLHAGEIVGVTGIGGMGQDEIPLLLSAAEPRTGGTVELGEPPILITRYEQAVAAGIAYVPANRRRDGGWREGTAEENATLPSLDRLAKPWWLGAKRLHASALEILGRTRVHPMAPAQPFGTFSGGNQQKIVLGKWLQRAPRVLILHEPTQGVDVGARRELLMLVNEAAAGGAAVLVCSNDFEQLAEICQRVVVFADGRAIQELSGPDVTEARLAATAQLAPA